jgi:hypothetical protein
MTKRGEVISVCCNLGYHKQCPYKPGDQCECPCHMPTTRAVKDRATALELRNKHEGGSDHE